MQLPQSIPTIGTKNIISYKWKMELATSRTSILLNWEGSQNGIKDIANLLPMIEIGIVEPSNATNTAGNLKQNKIHISFWIIVDIPYNETVWKICLLLQKKGQLLE